MENVENKKIFLSLEELYQEISLKRSQNKKAKTILEARDWLNSICEFDTRDGSALPKSISKIYGNEYFNYISAGQIP